MRIIAAYDISTVEPAGRKRLARVAKLMKGFGVRVQKSVFECDLDESQFIRLRMALEAVLEMGRDSVLFYRMGDCCAYKTLRLGNGGSDPFDAQRFIL